MALYAVCATTRTVRARPCWLLEASSSEAALGRALELRRDGRIRWVPPGATLTIRRASRSEAARFRAFVQVRPATGPACEDGFLARRSERRALAFFEKLWRGEA